MFPLRPPSLCPRLRPAGGVFTNPVQVTITTAPTDAAIYYTLNGTALDETSTLYTAPFHVETATEVRARAYKAGYNESGIASATFDFPAPGVLDVSPFADVNSAGTTGGPFFPSSVAYTLTNSGGLTLNWVANASQNWLSLPATNGSLVPGTSTSVLVSVHVDAERLPAGSYAAVLTFSNAASGTQITRTIALSVNPIRMSLAPAGQGTFEIAIHGHSNSTYVIEASADLIQWTAIATNRAGTNGFLNFIDADAGSIPYRFYRGKPQR